MNPIQLKINLSYAEREETLDWIKSYCRRNKIEMKKSSYPLYARMFESLPPDDLILSFKSYHQMNCFVRQGNKAFPYFEFI